MFKPGDQVYLDMSDIRMTHLSPKLSHRRLGPFKIECQVGPLTYHLKLPHKMRQLHLVFNVVKLSATPEDPIPGRKPQVLPLSYWTAIQAIKVIFFTIITRITSSRDEFSPPAMFPRCPVMDLSTLLEQQSSGCDHHYRDLIKIIQRIS